MPDDDLNLGYDPDETTAAQINIAQLIQGRILTLISDMAAVDTLIKFGRLTDDPFVKFYSHFLTLYLMGRDILPQETKDLIDAYFADRAIARDELLDRSAERGLELAHRLQRDLEGNGLWQIFEPVPEPPFVGDSI